MMVSDHPWSRRAVWLYPTADVPLLSLRPPSWQPALRGNYFLGNQLFFVAPAVAGTFGFAAALVVVVVVGLTGCGFGLTAVAATFGFAAAAGVVAGAGVAGTPGFAAAAFGLAAAISAANRDRTASLTIQPANSPSTNPTNANTNKAATAVITVDSVPADRSTPRAISVTNASGPRIPA
jgi:hypothetical protein